MNTTETDHDSPTLQELQSDKGEREREKKVKIKTTKGTS